MTYRATSTEVNEVFELFCESIGKRVAATFNDTAAWTLDHAKEYGGYVIQEIINDGGAKEMPLGDQRYSPTQLVERMRFALRWLEHKDRDKE
jgi:hypothetical protein